MGVVTRRQTWLECIDVVIGWCCKEVYEITHITYPGIQRNVWKRVVDDIFESLELDKSEWVEALVKVRLRLKNF